MMSPIRRTILIHKQSMPKMYSLAYSLLSAESEKKRKELQTEMQVRLERSFEYETQLERAYSQNERLLKIIESLVVQGVVVSGHLQEEIIANTMTVADMPTGSRHLAKLLKRKEGL